MLIDLKKFSKLHNISGAVVHVGAHQAEELDTYRSLGLAPRVWVEAQTTLFNRLRARLEEPDDVVIQAAVWHIPGVQMHLNVSNDSQSSSLLEFGTHLHRYPDSVFIGSEECTTVTLGSILDQFDQPFALITLDIQGAELNALKSASEHLSSIPMVYTEVNFEKLYEDCALVGEVDEFLSQFDFKRVLTARQGSDGWGDALYIKETDIGKITQLRVLLFQFGLAIKWFIGLVHRQLRR